MRRRIPSSPWLEVAARTRIAELSARKPDAAGSTNGNAGTAADADREFKAAVRQIWALGDYNRFARKLIWEVGPVLVEAAGVQRGERVLDVAAGTGNVAIRAAQAGAEVIASDLTPEHFVAGRRNAAQVGVEVEWIEADAEALPFADGEFDVVLSAFGAMFAPRHQRVADELIRVCRPGGRIAMANFTPVGVAADFFAVFEPYLPDPREGDLPPLLWGNEQHVRRLLGDGVSSLDLTRRDYVERAAHPRAYCEFCKQTFGPVMAVYRSLAGRPAEAAALDRAFLRFAERANAGAAGGPAEYRYEYLQVLGTRAARGG